MDENIKNGLKRLPDDNKLFTLAYWSKLISWVLLAVGTLSFFLNIFNNYFDVYTSYSDNLAWMASILSSSLSYWFSIAVQFFVLQAVGEIVYLVIDIKERLLNEEA